MGTNQAPVDPVARQRARAVIWVAVSKPWSSSGGRLRVAAYLWDNGLAGGEAGRAAFAASGSNLLRDQTHQVPVPARQNGFGGS